MFSERVSTQVTGRPTRRAAHATTTCSGSAPNFAPNAPPTAGVISRTRSASTPSMRTTADFEPWAPWFGIQRVSRPSSPQDAAAARTSSGAAATRWFTTSCVTTTSQPAKKSSANSASRDMIRFVPCSGNSSVSSRRAAFMSTTAGSGS